MKKRLLSLMLALMMVFTFAPILQADANAAAQLYWPVPGHTALSQGYHDGNAIDISDGSIGGANVVAAIGGTVKNIYLCPTKHYGSTNYNGCGCNGFGTGLVIAGDDGRTYQYAHMQANSIPANVYHGAYVSAGQVIGKVGTTGNSTGNHLHFAISNTKNYWEAGPNPANESYIYSTNITMTWSKQTAESITKTNAKISATATASVKGNFTAASVKLWDASGKLVGQKSESVSYNLSYMNVFYDINSELGVQLKAGNTYKYQFTVTFNGKSYTSPAKTFTTAACTTHSYGAWKTTKAATCTATGTKSHTCTVCGATATQTIAKLGHNYVDGVCTNCGYVVIDAPTSLTATCDSASGSPKLTWNAVDGAVKYYVYRSNNKSSGYKYIGTAKTTSYIDSSADAGSKYYYRVRAVNVDVIRSAPSNIVARTCDCARPDVSIKLSSGHPKLSWGAIDSADKYYVYRSTSKDGTFSKVGSTTSTSFTDKTAKAGKTYYYKVKAINSNSAANSAYSSIDYIKAK